MGRSRAYLVELESDHLRQDEAEEEEEDGQEKVVYEHEKRRRSVASFGGNFLLRSMLRSGFLFFDFRH